MSEHKFELVSSEDGDWECLLHNGLLVDEGHSLSSSQVLEKLSEILGFQYDHSEIEEAEGSEDGETFETWHSTLEWKK